MQWLTAGLAVAALISCASQQGPRLLAMQVFEQRLRQQTTSLQGQHLFLVRVQNQSEETVSVDAISLTPQSNVVQFNNADQIVDEVLEPGETRDITIWVDVTAQQTSYVYTIDSVDVAVTCHSPAHGSFTETSPHSVTAVVSE